MDHGHLLDARAPHGHVGRDRQASLARRLARARRGHRTRTDADLPRGSAAEGLRRSPAAGSSSRDSATSARSPRACVHDAGAKIIAVSDMPGRYLEPERHRPRQARGALREGPRLRGIRRRREDLEHRPPRARLRHPHPGRQREPDPRQERARTSRRRSSSRAPTARRPSAPTRSCARRTSWSCPTSWPTPAA